MAVSPRPIVLKADGTLIELPVGGWLENILLRLEALEAGSSLPPELTAVLTEDGSYRITEDGTFKIQEAV